MAVAAAMFMTSCSADEGTEPGNDSKAYVVTNTYSVAPPLDADADFKVRVSTNSATESAYILLEKHADYSKHIAELGQEGYNDFVVKNGGLVKGVKGQSEVDTLFYGLKGEYMATVVAVNAKGQAQAADSVSFTGITWNKVCGGKYKFCSVIADIMGKESVDCELDVDANNPSSYRIKDVYGKGYNVKFRKAKIGSTDEQGNAFNYIVVPKFSTGLTYKTLGTLYMSDAYSFTGSEDYLDNGIYADNSLFIYAVYSVSKGAISQPEYDEFVPNN